MRVRGWYLPAWSWLTFKVVGCVAPPVGAGSSASFGPRRASRPMPRPLGFFVTMPRLSLIAPDPTRGPRERRQPCTAASRARSGGEELREPATALVPVAETRIAVDVAARA